MTPKNKLTFWKYLSAFGSFLSLLPLGLYLYWGNLSIYSLSYIVNEVQSTSNVDTPWIISIFLACQSVGIASSRFIAELIGIRRGLFVGGVIADVGLLCSYWAVQKSVLALMCTLSVVMGYGTGLITGSSLQLAVEWADNDVGKLMTIIQSGTAFGAVLVNEFVTLYSNPDDLTPDMKLGRVKYFTQKEVVDKVPSIFLILGIASVILQIVGQLMIRQKPKEETPSLVESSKEQKYDCFGKTDNSIEHNAQNVFETEASSSSEKQMAINSTTPLEEDQKIKDYHPKEMLKTASFYALWISFFIGDLPFLLIINYYKSFGQLWIPNDHFLTTLGTVIVFVNAFMTVLWGAAMDKFGVKNCFLVFMASQIIILPWYYFTPLVNRWLYFFVTVVFSCFADSLYACFTVATALLYGKKYVSTNLGLALTSAITLNIVSPYIMKVILLQLGWFALFAISSGGTMIALILVLFFIPRM